MPIRRLPLLLVACAVAGGLPRSAAAQPFDPGTISGVSTGLALRSAIQLAAVHCLTAEGDSLRGEALRMYEEIGAQQRRLLPLLVDYMRRDERAGPPAGYDSLARAADETIRRLDGVVERARGPGAPRPVFEPVLPPVPFAASGRRLQAYYRGASRAERRSVIRFLADGVEWYAPEPYLRPDAATCERSVPRDE